MSIRQGICPECGHDEVIEAQQAEFAHGSFSMPMCVTYDPRWVLRGQNPQHGHGELLLYVCRACGFCQWYAEGPATIPISSGHHTRLIKGKRPEAETPAPPETAITAEPFDSRITSPARPGAPHPP